MRAKQEIARTLKDQKKTQGTPECMGASLGELDWVTEFLDAGGTMEELSELWGIG